MRGLPLPALFYIITETCKAKICTAFFTTNQFALPNLRNYWNLRRGLSNLINEYANDHVHDYDHYCLIDFDDDVYDQ